MNRIRSFGQSSLPFQFPPQTTLSIFNCHVFDEIPLRNRVRQTDIPHQFRDLVIRSGISNTPARPPPPKPPDRLTVPAPSLARHILMLSCRPPAKPPNQVHHAANDTSCFCTFNFRRSCLLSARAHNFSSYDLKYCVVFFDELIGVSIHEKRQLEAIQNSKSDIVFMPFRVQHREKGNMILLRPGIDGADILYIKTIMSGLQPYSLHIVNLTFGSVLPAGATFENLLKTHNHAYIDTTGECKALVCGDFIGFAIELYVIAQGLAKFIDNESLICKHPRELIIQIGAIIWWELTISNGAPSQMAQAQQSHKPYITCILGMLVSPTEATLASTFLEGMEILSSLLSSSAPVAFARLLRVDDIGVGDIVRNVCLFCRVMEHLYILQDAYVNTMLYLYFDSGYMEVNMNSTLQWNADWPYESCGFVSLSMFEHRRFQSFVSQLTRDGGKRNNRNLCGGAQSLVMFMRFGNLSRRPNFLKLTQYMICPGCMLVCDIYVMMEPMENSMLLYTVATVLMRPAPLSLVLQKTIGTITVEFRFFNVPTYVVEVTVGTCVIKNKVIAAENWLGTFKNSHYIFRPIEGGDMVLIQEVVATWLKQFFFASHYVGIKQQTILPTDRKNLDPGEADCFTHTKGSSQFKQWDPGGCSPVYWKVTIQMEVIWNEIVITQEHGPNSNLEDKVDFNGGGNVMIQLVITSLISK